ncbi:hypothetical protein STEG23_017858 [Scotinomys teguina]
MSVINMETSKEAIASGGSSSFKPGPESLGSSSPQPYRSTLKCASQGILAKRNCYPTALGSHELTPAVKPLRAKAIFLLHSTVQNWRIQRVYQCIRAELWHPGQNVKGSEGGSFRSRRRRTIDETNSSGGRKKPVHPATRVTETLTANPLVSLVKENRVNGSLAIPPIEKFKILDTGRIQVIWYIKYWHRRLAARMAAAAKDGGGNSGHHHRLDDSQRKNDDLLLVSRLETSGLHSPEFFERTDDTDDNKGDDDDDDDDGDDDSDGDDDDDVEGREGKPLLQQ